MSSGSMRDPISKNKVVSDRGRSLMLPPGLHTCTNTQLFLNGQRECWGNKGAVTYGTGNHSWISRGPRLGKAGGFPWLGSELQQMRQSVVSWEGLKGCFWCSDWRGKTTRRAGGFIELRKDPGSHTTKQQRPQPLHFDSLSEFASTFIPAASKRKQAYLH